MARRSGRCRLHDCPHAERHCRRLRPSSAPAGSVFGILVALHLTDAHIIIIPVGISTFLLLPLYYHLHVLIKNDRDTGQYVVPDDDVETKCHNCVSTSKPVIAASV